MENNTTLTSVIVPPPAFDNGDIVPGAGTILWAFYNTILFVGILGGNALTIIAVRTCRRLRSMISNLFILSLATSDFIVGLALPYHLSFYLGSHMGRVRGLCLARFFLFIFACCVSILSLITISIDRYIAILYSLHYRSYMTRRIAVAAIIFNWTVGAAVAAIPMFWNHWNTAHKCEFDQVLPPWYMAGIITPAFSGIWTLMLVMYWRIMKQASKQANRVRNPRRRTKTTLIHSDWRSIQVVVFIMGCFSICWLPYFVVACAQIFDMCKTTPLLYKAAFSLAMTNSALNPVIYSWKNSSFRKAFVRILRCSSPNTQVDSNQEFPDCFKPKSISSIESRDNNEGLILVKLHFKKASVYTVYDPSYCLPLHLH